MTIKTIPIFLPGDKVAWVAAGPTATKPSYLKLVRCAEEIPVRDEDVLFDLATPDFSPFSREKMDQVLPALMDALAAGEPVYVGCMGGTGRTGTLLAILAAQHPAMSGREAIAYIRRVYRPHAVETEEQERQVEFYEDFTTERMLFEGREYKEVHTATAVSAKDTMQSQEQGTLSLLRRFVRRVLLRDSG